MYFVGVDGGTGDTEAVVVDESGAMLGSGHGGPSRHPRERRMHPDVSRHLVEAIQQALRQARLSASDLTSVSLNLSGDPEALTVANAREWLAPLHLPDSSALAVQDDGISVWAAGRFPDPAIWIALGTHWGSGGMLNGQRIQHPLERLDLDAENGAIAEGANLGTRALSRAVHSRLGGAPTRLFEAYCDSLGAKDVEGLIEWARAHTTGEERASLFGVAGQVVNEGDPIARELFQQAGEIIGQGTVAMGHYMGVQDGHVTILLAGKSWKVGPVLLEPFRRTTLAGLPRAGIRQNDLSQAQGSALLAMRQAGIEAGPAIYNRLGSAAEPC